MSRDKSLPHVMVGEFTKAFGASLDPRFWVTLIEEEYKELEEAVEEGNLSNILKEACDLLYVQLGFNNVILGAEQLDLIPDEEKQELMAKVTKAANLYDQAVGVFPDNVNLYEAFRRVHISNMSKLGEDGKPVRREDGKVLKGPNYKPPVFDDLLLGGKNISLVT